MCTVGFLLLNYFNYLTQNKETYFLLEGSGLCTNVFTSSRFEAAQLEGGKVGRSTGRSYC